MALQTPETRVEAGSKPTPVKLSSRSYQKKDEGWTAAWQLQPLQHVLRVLDGYNQASSIVRTT